MLSKNSLRVFNRISTRASSTHVFKDRESQKAAYGVVFPGYPFFIDHTEKGGKRDPKRLEGLVPSAQTIKETVDGQRDEDGVWHPPHAMEMPYMTFKDVAVNYHIKARKFRAPKFSDAEYKEITDKTTLNKECIEYVKDMWCNNDADNIDYLMMAEDVMEMFKKGVSKRTINLWLNHVTGDGEHPNESLRNLNWTRI